MAQNGYITAQAPTTFSAVRGPSALPQTSMGPPSSVCPFISSFLVHCVLMVPLQLLGLLRHSTWRQPVELVPALTRSFSRMPPSALYSALHRSPIYHSPARIVALAPCSRRHISLKSIFSMGTPQPSTSPIVVAHISRLEGEANANPTNVDKQLELFYALIETKTQAGRDLVMARWERMCEFVRRHLFRYNGRLTYELIASIGRVVTTSSLRQSFFVLLASIEGLQTRGID